MKRFLSKVVKNSYYALLTLTTNSTKIELAMKSSLRSKKTKNSRKPRISAFLCFAYPHLRSRGGRGAIIFFRKLFFYLQAHAKFGRPWKSHFRDIKSFLLAFSCLHIVTKYFSQILNCFNTPKPLLVLVVVKNVTKIVF